MRSQCTWNDDVITFCAPEMMTSSVHKNTDDVIKCFMCTKRDDIIISCALTPHLFIFTTITPYYTPVGVLPGWPSTSFINTHRLIQQAMCQQMALQLSGSIDFSLTLMFTHISHIWIKRCAWQMYTNPHSDFLHRTSM